MPEALMRFSWATFARKYPLSGVRSVPTMESATWCRAPSALSAARRLRPEVSKEFQHRLAFKRRRVGKVDQHLRAGHGLLKALASDRVHTGIRRGCEDIVTTLAQNRHGLRADQAAAADHDDLHSELLVRGPQTEGL